MGPRTGLERASWMALEAHRFLYLRAGSAAVIRGVVHRDWSCAVFSSSRTAPVRCLGRPLGTNELLLASASARLDLFVPADGVLCIAASESRGRLAPRQVRICVAADGTVERTARLMQRTAKRVGPPCDSVETLTSELARAAAFCDGTRIGRIARTPRVAAVIAACRLIDARFPATLTLKELAQHCGVAERTLEYGFRQVYDTTPLKFLKSQRLARNRAALLRPAAGAAVGRTARAFGFTHIGQYSIDYRRHFGESPSTTLARACSGGAAG